MTRCEWNSGKSGKQELCIWCCREESNPRPTDYESVALPTELLQRTGRRIIHFSSQCPNRVCWLRLGSVELVAHAQPAPVSALHEDGRCSRLPLECPGRRSGLARDSRRHIAGSSVARMQRSGIRGLHAPNPRIPLRCIRATNHAEQSRILFATAPKALRKTAMAASTAASAPLLPCSASTSLDRASTRATALVSLRRYGKCPASCRELVAPRNIPHEIGA